MKLAMTEEEIIKKYKSNPCEKHIGILADLNAVKPYVIKRILADAGLMEQPKAPGRKKGSKTQNIQEADKTLSNIEKNESIKTISVRGDMPVTEVVMPVPKYLIPDGIRKLCEHRIQEINVEMMSLCDEIDMRNAEREEIKAFLKGDFHEPKN